MTFHRFLKLIQARPSARVVAFALLVGTFGAAYASVLSSLVRNWSDTDMYAHGFLIPFISGYVIYARRDRFATMAIGGDMKLGLPIVLFGLMALILGEIGGVQLLAQLSLIATAAGIVISLLGRAWVRQLSFPLVYLLLMMPMWEAFTAPLHLPFQKVSGQLGTALLHSVSIPVLRDGLKLHLPNVTLEVAEACSGVNFLVAIIAIGIPQAYLALESFWRRAAAVGLAVLIAILSNGVRVALIGWLAYEGISGPDVHGPGHMLQGMFVAVMGFVLLFATIPLLARRAASSAATQRVACASAAPRGGVAITPIVTLVVVLLAVVTLKYLRDVPPVPMTQMLTAFPNNLDGWRAMSEADPPDYFASIGTDEELSRIYYGSGNRRVHIYVGYFAVQDQGKELVSYRNSTLHDLSAPVLVDIDGTRILAANEATVTRSGGRSQYILYWYDVNGRVTGSRFWAKVWTIWDSIVHQRANGTVVLLAADVADEADRNPAVRDVRRLSVIVADRLSRHLSD